MTLAASCGTPMNTGPIESLPASSGWLTVRKSMPNANWAALRRSTASPKVAKICASIGPSSTQRMMP